MSEDTITKADLALLRSLREKPKVFGWDMQLPSGGSMKVEVASRLTKKDMRLIEAVFPLIQDCLREWVADEPDEEV